MSAFSNPEIRVSSDELPPTWPENAVFVSNLLGLFFENDAQMELLKSEIGEVDSYGGRLLPVVDLLFRGAGGNLLTLERRPDPDLRRFFEEEAGLGLPEQTIFSHRDYLEIDRPESDWPESVARCLAAIRDHPAPWIDGYVTDHRLVRIAELTGKRTLSEHRGSRTGNDKAALHRFLEEAGLPVPRTEYVETPDALAPAVERLRRHGHARAVIKAAVGASGIGMVKIADTGDCRATLEGIPGHFFEPGPCLVQAWLRPGEHGISKLHSPSAQLFLDAGHVRIFDLTEQLLDDDSIHEGNESPPPYLRGGGAWRDELYRQAGEAGTWLHRQGYRGAASVDFLLAERSGGEATVYVCEINARVTGATYPSLLAKRFLPAGAWLLKNLRFREPLAGGELLAHLRDAHELFLPGRERGIFPVNFNFGPDGLIHKGQFLCLASSIETGTELLELARLKLPCDPDRD
jgi:hypothetical protein